MFLGSGWRQTPSPPRAPQTAYVAVFERLERRIQRQTPPPQPPPAGLPHALTKSLHPRSPWQCDVECCASVPPGIGGGWAIGVRTEAAFVDSHIRRCHASCSPVSAAGGPSCELGLVRVASATTLSRACAKAGTLVLRNTPLSCCSIEGPYPRLNAEARAARCGAPLTVDPTTAPTGRARSADA